MTKVKEEGFDEVEGNKEVQKKVKDEVEYFKSVRVKVKEEVEEVDIVDANFGDEHLVIKTECRVDDHSI